MTAAGDIDDDDDYDGCTLGSQTHPLSITQHPLIKVHRSQRIDRSAIVIVNPTANPDRRCGLKQKKPSTMAIDVGQFHAKRTRFEVTISKSFFEPKHVS